MIDFAKLDEPHEAKIFDKGKPGLINEFVKENQPLDRKI
jgi:hypothetical protein